MSTTELIFNKRTYHRIPEVLLEKQLSLKAVYLYSKLTMLQGKNYCLTALGRTIGYIKPDLSRQQVAVGINELKNSGLITVDKMLLEGNSYESNIYGITTLGGFFKPVYNDFINRGDLSVNVRGFAILLSLLKEIPTSVAELSSVLNISAPSCKKYIKILTDNNILVKNKLNEDYFPNLFKEVNKQKFINRCLELKQIDSRRIKNQVTWLESVDMDYSWKLKKLLEIEMGTFTKQKAEKDLNK